VAAGFCLPDGVELVGLCAGGAGGAGDCVADGRIAGDKHGDGESREIFEERIEARDVKPDL